MNPMKNAEREIQNLMNDYCYALDSGDLATFARLMQHAQWIAEGKTSGKESQSNLILYADGTPRTKHRISNISINVDGANNFASAHSYVTVYQQASPSRCKPFSPATTLMSFNALMVSGDFRNERFETL